VTLDHPTGVFLFGKKTREVPRKVAKQNGNWSTSPSGHGCFKHHSDSPGAELKSTLFDGELGGGVTPLGC